MKKGPSGPGRRRALPVAGRTGREAHDHPVEVVTIASAERAPRSGRGSVAVIVGGRRSQLVERARDAARGGDEERLDEVLEAHVRASSSLRSPRADAAALPITQMSYRGIPVANPTVAGERDSWCVSLPFAGSALDPDGFSTTSWVIPGERAPAVAALAIVREPKLSHLERAVLDHPPDELRLAGGDRDPVVGTTLDRLVELRAQLMRARRLS